MTVFRNPDTRPDDVIETPRQLILEDMTPGRTFVSSERVITAEDIVAFGRQFDPQVFHVDPEAAADSFFGAHVASGWHTTAFTMKLMVETLPIAGGVIGAGCEKISWPRPVCPGDRLHLVIEVETARASTSRPDIGIVGIKVTTLNQHGDAVQIMHPRIVVPLRGAE